MTTTYVVASTYAQAELAMRELQVPAIGWRLVRNSHDLDGVPAVHIVVVSPLLEVRETDKRRRLDVDWRVLQIEQRDGVNARRVRT